MSTSDTVTLPCGCIIGPGTDGVTLTAVCSTHTQNPQALALLASQDPVVQALATAAGQTTSSPGGFSYGGSPATSLLDKVRFTIADTKAANRYFTDSEILSVLQDSNNNYLTASLTLIDALIARYAFACDQSVGEVSESFSQLISNLRELSDTLRARMGRQARAYAGGISNVDSRALAMNPLLKQPFFRRTEFLSPQLPGDTRYLGRGSWFIGYGQWPLNYWY